MALYQRIVVAIDLTEDSKEILSKAMQLADGAKITLVHVIEPLAYAYGGDIPMDLTEVQGQLQQQATDQLLKLAKTVGIPVDQQHVVIGHPSGEIHRVAEEVQADLIIVGSHGRQGLALLLGSTSNGVLHGTKCDVLAVRVNS